MTLLNYKRKGTCKVYNHSMYTQITTIKIFFSLQYIRMSEKNINFDDKKITFYKNKRIYSTDDIDINNILVSNHKPYGNKNSL